MEMGKSCTAPTVRTEARERLTERLSRIDDLYYPRKVQHSAADNPASRKAILLELLERDVAIFLERYGSILSLEELKEFDVLKDDYEINFHLNRLRSVLSPTDDEKKSNSAKIKNRRLAYMDQLILGGHYFSEESMREREPYIHHEYVGKFQDLSGRSMARPGERWSETLMRRSEEAILVEKIRGEQQRLGVAQRDWVGNEIIKEEEEEEEEEEESDEEVDVEENVGELEKHPIHNGRAEPTGVDSLSVEEMQDRMDQFTNIMHQKFLSGEDNQHMNYSKIDKDETLDDHWMKEANQDAEEMYFKDIGE